MSVAKTPTDRFLIALLLAAIIHAVIILGIGFEPPKPQPTRKSLSITLVPRPTPEAPKRADYLAQENQSGDGAGEKKALPRAQESPHHGVEKGTEPSPLPPPARPTAVKRKPLLTRREPAEKKVIEAEAAETPQEAPPRPLDMGALSQQIAEVSAALNDTPAAVTRAVRKVPVNAINAHKYKAAAYEQAWQQKVERIGNLNYPDQARREKLSGSLVLEVGIRSDGSVDQIKVLQSSGHQVLDDAAVRIVRLAEPFAPFPEELKRETDVLLITRTWRFYSDYRMEAH